jgi:phosphatidylglycerol---prolipoprotein diacylglyceryl transferase
MWPEIEFATFRVSTNLVLLAVSVVGSLILCRLFLARSLGALKCVALVTFTTVFGILGGRLFHVFVERWSYFREHPAQIFSRFDGMTLYGSVGGAAICFFVCLKLFRVSRAAYGQAWDLAAIAAAWITCVLRLGCFAGGCCWGRPAPYPWAVQFFDTRAHMPLLGVPVHPVQLYESALAGLLMIYLFVLRSTQKWSHGQLIWHYFLFYGLIRLGTEEFRADSIRGFVMGGFLSTSQAISIVMICVSLSQLAKGLRWPSINLKSKHL